MSKFLRPYLLAMLLAGLVMACGSAPEGTEEGNTSGSGQSSVDLEKEEFPNETASQKKARHKADEYLSVSAHSRTGLIEQLESDKFSNADSTYAVDALGVDWRDQAARRAKEHMDDASQSRDGLKDQLKLEGFTDEEAEYGVSQHYN